MNNRWEEVKKWQFFFRVMFLAVTLLISATSTRAAFSARQEQSMTKHPLSQGRSTLDGKSTQPVQPFAAANPTTSHSLLSNDHQAQSAGEHALFLPLVQANPAPPQGSLQLAFDDTYHSQRTETYLPNACGPTALLITLDYWDIAYNLTPVISATQAIPPSQGGYDPDCYLNPVCTSPGALVRVARDTYGMSVDAHEGWTFADVYDALAQGRPVIADVVYHLADEGQGHFVVIYGIDMERQRIYYHDPFDGASLEGSWQKFSASWDGPVDVYDPLQPQGHRFWGMAVYR